ncbi:histone-lysine N-methyltransferase, H3 lysine-79 specific-like [Glycine soja]|uniref:histone-lysine N-methyltransferase, H3 lysine-79 specific-like n=1 Tax=Glycine soja TaxID=3848 RepID=UPI0010388F3C|nr:histone-lysine N-methyltransferase, H3 lysine-79 specific-like [Glycine soja]
MASEQMHRRGNSNRVIEREVHVETHRKESIADKGRVEIESEKKEKERELASDRARSGNIVKDKEVEERRRGRESGGGVQHVRKFETKGEEKKRLGEEAELEGITRVVVERECNKEEKQRSMPRGNVEAQKARSMERTREEAKGREQTETKGQIMKGGGEEQGRRREENKQSNLEEISKYSEAQQKTMKAIEGAKERYERAQQEASKASKERNGQANEGAEEGRRESGGDVHHVAKFETKGEEKKDSVGKAELEGRTRVVVRRDWNKEEKQRCKPRWEVEVEKARPMEKTEEEARTEQAGTKGQIKKGGGEEQGRRRREET